MKSYSLRVIALASIPAFGACAEDVSGPTGPGVKVAVAPLQLTNIGDACYDIAINNATGNVVTLTNICASQYGNGAGGDISYIAPCDASADADTDTNKDGVQNSVNLKPYLYDSVGGALLTDWRNPCDTDPADGIEGCVATFDCNENADTLIEFNLTVLRSAQQGFFDVAVNFSDIFCSAKVDCRYPDEEGNPNGDWIRLVHSGSTRTSTAVVAFACTDGNFVADAANATTRLYASNVTVTCDGGSYSIPVDEAGNVFTSNPDGPVAQAIVFTGAEALTVNGQNAGKLYWNTAIGFDEGELSSLLAPHLGEAGANCTLSFTATASQGDLDLTTNGYLSHPFLEANVTLTDEDGLVTCGQHPINSTQFTTEYYSSVGSTNNALAWTLDASAANAGKARQFRTGSGGNE